MLILPDATDKSRKLLTDAIADRFRITFLVIGDEGGEDVIASKADIRAQALASTRRVVWVRNPALLREDEYGAYTRNGAAVACVLNLDDQPVAWLSHVEAGGFAAIERAFLLAQQGG